MRRPAASELATRGPGGLYGSPVATVVCPHGLPRAKRCSGRSERGHLYRPCCLLPPLSSQRLPAAPHNRDSHPHLTQEKTCRGAGGPCPTRWARSQHRPSRLTLGCVLSAASGLGAAGPVAAAPLPGLCLVGKSAQPGSHGELAPGQTDHWAEAAQASPGFQPGFGLFPLLETPAHPGVCQDSSLMGQEPCANGAPSVPISVPV